MTLHRTVNSWFYIVNIDGVNTCSHLPKTWEMVLSLRTWNGKSPPQAQQARLIILTAWKQRLSPNPFWSNVTLETLTPSPTVHDLQRLPAERIFLSCFPPSLKQKMWPFATLLISVDLKVPISYLIYKGYTIKFSSIITPPPRLTSQLILKPSPPFHRNHSGIEHQQPNGQIQYSLFSPHLTWVFWPNDTTTTPFFLQRLFSPSSHSVLSTSLPLALLTCLLCGCLHFHHLQCWENQSYLL